MNNTAPQDETGLSWSYEQKTMWMYCPHKGSCWLPRCTNRPTDEAVETIVPNWVSVLCICNGLEQHYRIGLHYSNQLWSIGNETSSVVIETSPLLVFMFRLIRQIRNFRWSASAAVDPVRFGQAFRFRRCWTVSPLCIFAADGGICWWGHISLDLL